MEITLRKEETRTMKKRYISRWLIGIFLVIVCLFVAALVLRGNGLLPRGAGSSTQVDSNVLVTSAENNGNFREIKGKVTLLNRSTGKPIWQKQMAVDNLTPAFASGLVYVVTEKPWGSSTDNIDTLEALSLANGQQIWSWSWHMDMPSENPPIIRNGVVYLSESTYVDNTYSAPVSNSKYQSFVVALQASSGRQLWKDSLVGNLSRLTIADDGSLYVSNGAVVLALSGNDGQRRWQYVPPSNDSLNYYTNASPEGTSYAITTQGERVYVILRYVDDGVHTLADLVALNKQNGQEEWRYQMYTDASVVPFLSYQGVIYLTYNRFPTDSRMPSGSFLVALNGENGSILWTYRQDDQDDMSQPLVVGDVLYIAENGIYISGEVTQSRETSDVVVLHRSDGRVMRRYTFPKGIGVSAPVVSGSTFYLGEYMGTKSGAFIITVVAFDLKTGRKVWSAKIPQQFGDLSIIVSQGQIYAYSPWDYEPDTLVVFQESSGRQEWVFPAELWIYHVVPDVG